MLIDYTYGKIIMILFLVACAIDDIRKQSIDTRLFICMLLLTIGGYVWMGITGKSILWLRMGIGVLAGGLVWLVAFLTRQQIGYGDATFFTLTGLVYGCKNVLMLAGTMMFAAVVALVICVINLIEKNSKGNYAGRKLIKSKSYPLLPLALPVGIAVMFLT